MKSTRYVLLFGFLAIVWGTAFAAIEVGLETLPPILFAALRFDLAAVAFLAAALALGRFAPPRTRADWTSVAVGGVLIVGAHYALSFLGQSYVSSSVAAIVTSLTPVVTPLLALAVLPRTRLRAPQVVGLLAGLAGVVAVALPGGTLDGRAVGVALLFASVVAFALGSVLAERSRPSMPLLSLQAWAMAAGAVVLHALSALHPGESIRAAEVTLASGLALAYLSLVATAGGFLVYFLLLDRVGATELALVNYAVPVVATLVGWAALGESVTSATVAGFALILLGFALCKARTLWKLLAPAAGYGPRRRVPGDAGVVVDRDGNAYVTHAVGG